MTKPQALALMAALEANKVGADALLRFDQAGAESWQVAIPPEVPLTGVQLGQLATYCAQNGLALSAQFSYLGIV